MKKAAKHPPKNARKPEPTIAPDSPKLWTGLVADLYRYKPFIFPGMPTPPPAPLPLVSLGELVRERAAAIEKNRWEGLSEYWAAALASSLIDWLAGRAAEGSKHAQAELIPLSCKAVDWYSWSLSQGHEKTLESARKSPDMPGRVSLNPEVTADWQALLERIRQGSETPVPMNERNRRNVYGANHFLAASLFQYMEDYRNHGIAKVFSIPSDHPEIPERIREILLLPPLGLKDEAWKKWHKIGMKVVKDATRENPATHEAFNRPALSSLMNLTGQGKHTLTRDLPAAWKALASSKSSLAGET